MTLIGCVSFRVRVSSHSRNSCTHWSPRKRKGRSSSSVSATIRLATWCSWGCMASMSKNTCRGRSFSSSSSSSSLSLCSPSSLTRRVWRPAGTSFGGRTSLTLTFSFALPFLLLDSLRGQRWVWASTYWWQDTSSLKHSSHRRGVKQTLWWWTWAIFRPEFWCDGPRNRCLRKHFIYSDDNVGRLSVCAGRRGGNQGTICGNRRGTGRCLNIGGVAHRCRIWSKWHRHNLCWRT